MQNCTRPKRFAQIVADATPTLGNTESNGKKTFFRFEAGPLSLHPARLNVRTFGLLVLVTAQHARLLRAAKASLEGRVERQPPCSGSGGEFLEILQVLDMQQGVA
jgi:hypothetical protein